MHRAAVVIALLVLIAPEPAERLSAPLSRGMTVESPGFPWLGVTAFRLVDHIADGRERDAIAYLDWARTTGFTLVRVLTRLTGWADLSAADGQRHLPRLLALAAERKLHVEVVATVGSGGTPYDFRSHAREIARLCAESPTCLFEFANEPGHPSQAAELHDMATVDRLAASATRGFPKLWWTAGPSWSSHDDEEPSGRYIVRHLERAGAPLEQIARLRDLALLSVRTGKFVVSDEPTGADEQDGASTGRQRWNRPELFFAMGALCRGFQIGCTFHLQDGLATVVPGPVQQQCARAFIDGWRAMPPEMRRFVDTGARGSPVGAVRPAALVEAYSFLNDAGASGVTVALHSTAAIVETAMPWARGWGSDAVIARQPNVTIWRVSRRPGWPVSSPEHTIASAPAGR